MKRFTSLDISAITRELREKVVGLRIANVYDLGKKTYQLKLAKPDHKQYLVFESGVRLHTTKFQRERQTVPSVFCLKLRRYLRTKRIEDVRQLGIDRVIDITIGSGEAQHHLIIELYASGNIILVDKNYAIETLIRSYKTGEGTDDEVSVAVGTRYPVDKARQLVPTTVDRLREVLHSVPEELRAKEAVKDVLNRHLDLGPALFEHCLLCADLKPHAKVSEYDEAKTEALHRAIQHAESLYSDPTLKGYIVLKDTKPDAAPAAPAKAPPGKGKGKDTKQQPQEEEGRAEEQAHSPVVSATPAPQDAAKPDGEEDYDSRLFMMFVPYVYKQFEGRPRLEFPSFDEAVDIFFSKAQEQQVEVKKEQQEKTVKKDHETRIAALTKAEEECIKKAHLIETNVSDVDAAIKVTCSELARGMDWAQLTRVVKEAKKAGDPIANLIHSLDFANNRITLLLVDPLEAAADASGAMQKVEVDIGQTAYANAQEFYAEAKRRAHKHAKTVASSQMAVKAAEKKARREIKDVGVKAAIQKVRKAYWFEKFHWFISSENYVVISGRDAQQNELIVKRYLRKGDAYVHADLHGAATCVVKNPHPDKPIPALTLAEAGSMTVCRSSAWTAKARAIPTSAWWVHPEQVSKTAPSGEYLVTGSFMIRGKKNFLPPSQLVMGFAYMFKVDPTSVANHVNERAVRTLVELSELEGAGRGDAERSAAGGSDDEDQDGDGDGKAVEGGAKGHAGKYRVQVLMDTPDDDADAGSSSGAPQQQPRPPQKEREKRARMSAAEKRRKKKLEKRGESAAAAPADEEPSPDHHHHHHHHHHHQEGEEGEEDNDGGEEEAQQQQQQQPKTKGPTQPKLLRGQKGKMKKMKKKYAEQDEEERDLRMRLLQSEGLKKKEEQRLKELELQKKRKGKGRGQAGRGGLPYHHHQQPQQQGAGRGEAARAGRGLPQKTPASPSGEGKEDGEEEVALAQPADEDVARVVAGGGGVAMAAGDGARDEGEEEARDEEGEGVAEAERTGVVEEEEEEEEEGLEAKRKRRQEKRHEKKKEAEEIRQIMEEENIKPLDESLLSEIDALTGVPVVEDALLFAVPVCAPYSVVQNYKYKIKLVPGSVKRGKAAKEAMSYFVSFPEATDRERDLLKAVEDSEIVLQLIGNVRIATSGLKQKAKSGKKGKSGKKK